MLTLPALCLVSLLSTGPAQASRFVFETNPALDLYFQVRAASAPGKESPLPALAPAIELVRALDHDLGGSPLAWAPLDGLLSGCKSVADLRTAFERAPEKLSTRGGGSVELRARILPLADALEAAEQSYAPLAAEHAKATAAMLALWKERVGAKEPELVACQLAGLGMKDPELELHVVLLGVAPWPGAVTVRDAQGHGVSFVGANAAEGTLLLEVILHEATHSLDLVAGDHSALSALRERLTAAGLTPRDRRLADLPHGLMFVQSAESIRRVIDPAHRDYGATEDVYARIGPAAELLRGYWRDRLDGKLDQDAALDQIVAGLGLEKH